MPDPKGEEGWARSSSRLRRSRGSGRLSGFAIGLGAGSLLSHLAPQTNPWPIWVVIAASVAAIAAGVVTIVLERGHSVVTMALGAVGATAGLVALVVAFVA